MKEHGQKVEGSYIHPAEFWESCTGNSSSSFEPPFQNDCTEAGERPVKATKIIKAGPCDLSGVVDGAELIQQRSGEKASALLLVESRLRSV